MGCDLVTDPQKAAGKSLQPFTVARVSTDQIRLQSTSAMHPERPGCQMKHARIESYRIGTSEHQDSQKSVRWSVLPQESPTDYILLAWAQELGGSNTPRLPPAKKLRTRS